MCSDTLDVQALIQADGCLATDTLCFFISYVP